MKFPYKRALALALVFSGILLAATSCKKSNNNNSANGSMTATVNGTAWSNNLGTVGLYTIIGGQFGIAGGQLKSGDTTAFELSFVSPIALNQTISSDTSQILIVYSDNKTQQAYDGYFGIGYSLLTITSYDSTGHTVGGTFSGVLYNSTNSNDSVVVTNGKFNTSFTAQ
jgi:hypothetical protein